MDKRHEFFAVHYDQQQVVPVFVLSAIRASHNRFIVEAAAIDGDSA